MFLKKSSFGTSRMPGPVSVYVAVKDFKLCVAERFGWTEL